MELAQHWCTMTQNYTPVRSFVNLTILLGPSDHAAAVFWRHCSLVYQYTMGRPWRQPVATVKSWCHKSMCHLLSHSLWEQMADLPIIQCACCQHDMHSSHEHVCDVHGTGDSEYGTEKQWRRWLRQWQKSLTWISAGGDIQGDPTVLGNTYSSKATVLSSLNFSLFMTSKLWSSWMQSMTQCGFIKQCRSVYAKLQGMAAWLSSAYRWNSRPWQWMILPVGMVWNVRSWNPSIEPGIFLSKISASRRSLACMSTQICSATTLCLHILINQPITFRDLPVKFSFKHCDLFLTYV